MSRETMEFMKRLVDRSALLGYIEGRLMATVWTDTSPVGEFAKQLLEEIAEKERFIWTKFPLPETEEACDGCC